LFINVEPLSITSSSADVVSDAIVNTEVTVDLKFIVVLFVTVILLTVWVGIAVAVEFPPVLKTNLSYISG